MNFCGVGVRGGTTERAKRRKAVLLAVGAACVGYREG